MSFSAEEDLTCPVCQDLFRDPLVLSCSHSFCRACLQSWWTGNSAQECPVCKRRSSRSEPPRNLALKNLCEALSLQKRQRASVGSEPVCSLHCEKLKLFCLDHQKPACLVCRDSKIHHNHRFRPVHELAQDRREELQNSLEPLREKLKLCQRLQDYCDQTTQHIGLQARRTQTRIQEQFEELRRLLREDEEARISAVREEEEQKIGRMKEKSEALSGVVAALTQTIQSTEDQLRSEDVAFLLNFRSVAEQVQKQRHPLEEPAPLSGTLIDMAKHLGNLPFNVWYKMKDRVTYTPVILDPNTANAEFILSDDLTSVSHGDRQKVPENQERMDYHRSVRGWEGFSSGIHTWDVDVRDNDAWFVGTAAEFLHKPGQIKSGFFWQLEFYNGRYSARRFGEPPEVLRVRRKLQRVRVYLDWNRGKVSFFDPDVNSHIHTFTHSFTDTIFPCLGTLTGVPLRVLPGRVSVSRDSITDRGP